MLAGERGPDVHRYDVLGVLRIDGDVARAPSRPAQRRLVSLLLLERGAPISRDTLIERMWPDGAPAGAVNTLQAHVSGVRRLLGADAVLTGSQGYQLPVDADAVDADRFATLVDHARTRRGAHDDGGALDRCDTALRLWRGTPYPDVIDHPAAVPEVERLEELHVAVRSLRAATLLDLGHWHEATEELDRLLEQHAHRERLWELLMLAHYRAGRAADALAAYRDARTALGELGLDPGRPLRELERRMLVQDPTLLEDTDRPAAASGAPRSGARLDHGVHAWPLVNRAAEVARLDEVVMGDARGAVLVGPAGVGKTRLLHEVARRAPSTTATVVVQANASLRGIPLGAVSDLARLAPGPVAAQLEELLAVLRSMTTDRPPLVLVDDAHQLDDATLGLFVKALQGDDVRLVATVRNEDAIPDAITSWWKDLGLERIAVGALQPHEFDQLLDQVLGAVSAATHARLVELAAGNPLHLREVLRAARDEGALVHEGGEWQLVRGVAGAGRLSELVDLVLRGLSRPSRTGLEVLALARPTSRELVDEVAGPAAVDELQRAGLVRLEADGRAGILVDTAHPLYAENLAARMDDGRRRELGARVAGSLSRLGFPRSGDLLLAATLALDAGALDVGLALRASRDAMVRLDAELSRRLAQAAVDAGGGAEAWMLLGRARAFTGAFEEGDEAMAHAAELATPEQLAEIDSQRAAALAFGQREPARAVAVLDDALRTLPAGAPMTARLRVERSLYLAMSGRMDEVIDEVATLRELALPPPVQLTVGLADTLARVMLGRHDGLQAALDATEQLVDGLEADFPTARAQLEYNRVEGLVGAGRLDEAQRRCDAWGARVADGTGLFSLWYVTATHVLEVVGRIDEALAIDAEADTRLAGEPDPFRVGLMRPGLRALLLAQAGRLAEARQLLAEVDVETLRSDARTIVFWRQAQAWAQLPDHDRAARAFLEAGRTTIAQGHATWGVHALYGAVRVGRPELVVDDLRAAVASMPGAALVVTLADSAAAHADGDVEGLSRVAERLAAHGARLLAAEAHAEVARLAAGTEAAGAARQEAATLASGLGAHTPALAGVPTSAVLA